MSEKATTILGFLFITLGATSACHIDRSASTAKPQADASTVPIPGPMKDGATDVDCSTIKIEPIVRYTFDELQEPVTEILDEASAMPEINLEKRTDDPYVSIDNNALTFQRNQGKGAIVISTTDAGSALSQTLTDNNAFSVAVWFSTPSVQLTDFEPARIVTLSQDTGVRAFTVGQEGSELVFRVRTTATDENGIAWNNDYAGSAQNASLVLPNQLPANEPKHLVQSYDGATHIIYFQGQRATSQTHDLSSGGFGSLNWEGDLRLALGNELSADRPWLGTLYRVEIYGEALSSRQASCLSEEQP